MSNITHSLSNYQDIKKLNVILEDYKGAPMLEYPYERPVVTDILRGMGMEKKLLHIITGPRQVGKTTAALQVAEKWRGPVVNSSADSPLPQGPEGIQAQ